MNAYMQEAFACGFTGVPIGLVAGYALAKIEDYVNHTHSHQRRRR